MMLVEKNKCIGCGLCIKDCPCKCIKLVDDCAVIDNAGCLDCGHCIAICPKKAVVSDTYDMNEVVEYNKETFDVRGENLLNFIKFRRSIRAFDDKPVEVEKIEKIIEAGRFTQTSTNSQDVTYIVVRDNIQQLRAMVLESLNEKGKYLLNNLTEETKRFEKYARMWTLMYEMYKRDPKSEDRIYFDAPVLIMVVSRTAINGGLASTNMELITNALGLGTFYSGFTVRAAEGNDKIREFLGLQSGENVITCMAIGYPAVKYQRTVPRKEATIAWK